MNDYIQGLLVGMVIGVVVCLTPSIIDHNPPKEQPQIETCECLNYYEWTYWSTKRDRVLNKRKRTSTDSIELRNADRILGLDETLDNPPKR